MGNDAKQQCADLIVTDVIQDFANQSGVPVAEVRNAVITSPLYEQLYDFDNGLWREGPDAIADLMGLADKLK